MNGNDVSIQEFNWNPTPEESDVIQYHLTNFKLTRPDGEMTSLLVEKNNPEEQFFHLQGELLSKTTPPHQKRIVVKVNQYFIDLGVSSDPGQPNPTQGFWMFGGESDTHYKLELPADPQFRDFAAVVELAENPRLMHRHHFPFESVLCLHMTDFSLTDRDIGAYQTPILSSSNKSLLALQGTILVNDAAAKSLPLQSMHKFGELQIQTYVESKYVIDLGTDKFAIHPEFCLQDCHGTWVRLREPPHTAYRDDFTNTLKRTVLRIESYNWPAERGEIWRHVTNCRLTDKAGTPHDLEIADLDSEFTLWCELVPPPRSPAPPVQIMLCVNSHSLDTGRSLYDPSKGVWMQDVRGDWYMLGEPAPDFQHIAAPLLDKAAKYIHFHDALLFQDNSADISLYLKHSGKYLCNYNLNAVQERANPKFDMYFIQEHKAFVRRHLASDFDFDSSVLLLASIDNLSGELTQEPMYRSEEKIYCLAAILYL